MEHFCLERNIQDLYVLSRHFDTVQVYFQFVETDRGTPNTACAELDSGLIEEVSDLHLLPGARPHPTHQKKNFIRMCLWRVVLRKVYFDHVAKGRVVQDGFVQSRVVQGRVVKDGVIFDERIIMGQIVHKRVVQNPAVQGLMVQGRCSIWQIVYTQLSCRGSTCQKVVFQILNTGKILVGRQFML